MRVLSLTLIILWVLIPQVVCFLPNEQMTEMEMECCKHMAADCGQANMQEHKCCTGVVKPDAAIVTAVHRTLLPHTAVAPPYISEAINFSRVIAETAAIVGRNIHPPPGDPNASLVVLRI
jgi:hypothetical protein